MEDSKAKIMSSAVLKWVTFRSRDDVIASMIAITMAIGYVIVVFLSGGKPTIIAVFPLAALLLFIVSSFELSLVALVASLFVNLHVLEFNSAVWFSLPFGLSFLLRYWDVKWHELDNPMTVPILVYGVSILPSFLNATRPLVSLAMLFNVVAFLVVMYALVAALRTHDDLRKVVAVYLGFVLANSVHVFAQSVAGQLRPLGFAGIMFVDYSALGVCVAAAMSAISSGRKRLFFLLLSSLFGVALMLTQTRNTWLSALITLAILVGYLMLHTEVAGLSRKRLIVMAVIGSLALAGAVALVVLLNPQIETRATELTDKPGPGISESGSVENSLGSRLLIWDTALNAFRAHPYIGIGVYGFPYSSQHYYTIPKFMYRLFVAGNSPHQTYLAVLAETGVIGALGFAVFLFAILRYAFQTIRRASEERGRKYAFVGAIAVVYCVVSMVFTDAWLWGQGIVMLGLVIGLVLANRKISRSFPEDGATV